jgi:hypothetical protein
MTTESQDSLAYKCKCGFTHTDKTTFNKHLMNAGKKDGKGVHASEGRVNMATGEIIMPSFDKRTPDQVKASTYALKKKDEAGNAIRQTEIIQDALQIKFVPRVLVCSLTPIMIAGRAAAIGVWGWPENMPLDSLIDTVFLHFFGDRGIKLASFVIDNPEEQAETRKQNVRLQTESVQAEEATAAAK